MSTGILAGATKDGKVGALGSCAIYRQRHLLLTAAHCIPPAGVDIYAQLPGDDGTRQAVAVEKHPQADLALVVLEARENESLGTQVFTGIPDGLVEGGDFSAFGYPDEGVGKPVGRYFKGHFQRYLGHTDSAGHSYFAGELSVAAPAGLSGGPVVLPLATQSLVALVTQNVESYAIVDSIDEVEADGTRFRAENRRIVTYGLSIMLMGVRSWIDETIDPYL